MSTPEIETLLFAGLTDDQKAAVKFGKRRLLVVAGAGSGKTEVMARRIAWWVGVKNVPKDNIVAFTFTERAAEEMKFRIRGWIERITPEGQEVSLGNMYIGTIHGFCIAKIREFWPDEYHNYDILDEASRSALILRGFNGILALQPLRAALGVGQYATIDSFTQAYDQLHEHNLFKIKLASDNPPIHLGEQEREWCKQAELVTDVGETDAAKTFGKAAARYYAYLRCRRFLDFSTSQSEFIRRLAGDKGRLREIEQVGIHLVVDEVQDINPVQRQLIELLTGETGRVTAVGDHRQAIYGFRGAKVEIIAELWEAFKKASDAGVVDLKENFRSTPRIIDLANRWTNTLSPLLSMKTPPMKHGNKARLDYNPSHVALIDFDDREDEATWIAEAIRTLVPSESEGALHDKKDGQTRGLAFSDIAVLVRSSTSVRTYMRALETAGVPSVVRAGPDLFSQPEVLLLLGALGVTARQEEFIGSEINPKSMPNRIKDVLGCDPKPAEVLKAAARLLRQSGLSFDRAAEDRLLLAAEAIGRRVNEGHSYTASQVAALRTPGLRTYLTAKNEIRRVFPQQLFHFLLSEAGVDAWDSGDGRGQTAMFHLGALSGLITGIETPGWTSAQDYRWQIIGLCQYGAEEGRAEEQPLMVQPDAVSISTIHSVKGLEFAAVFVADVQPMRFPSSFAKRVPNLPLEGKIRKKIDIDGLADNDNNDGERRLMYVALTRAERFLIFSHSGKKTSKFIKELKTLVADTGGRVTDDSGQILHDLKYAPKETRRDVHLATSFSDLRYYLECPHDFYLRKVLGFAPTIDQAFGYGRGVHNLLRAIHSDPKKWAALAKDRPALERAIQSLIDRGLFYLRYTTSDPAENMRKKGLSVVGDYVSHYAEELGDLDFEPEKAFETLIEYGDGEGGALITGAIDIVRQDEPPRVTLIDFKSGDPDSDNHQKLDEREMKLQVAIYAVGAKKELEYQPEKGMVRYLGVDKDAPDERRELEIPLDDKSIVEAKALVAQTARSIRDRHFHAGPVLSDSGTPRCPGCDFLGLCGMKEAAGHKKAAGKR
jgi:DNA helicase II / ATP-dependent DNA helicase PcrA